MNPHVLLGGGTTNGDGGFQLETPRTASTRFFEVYALAAAPGFGLGWAELNPDAAQAHGRDSAQAPNRSFAASSST